MFPLLGAYVLEEKEKEEEGCDFNSLSLTVRSDLRKPEVNRGLDLG